jgi:hypothetical protein
MRRRSFALAEVILVLVLGVSSFEFGVVATRLAEPAAARSLIVSSVHRPAAPAAVAMPGVRNAVHACEPARQAACADLGPDTNPPGRRHAGEALPSGRFAVWSTVYEPQDALIELIHSASAARGRPIALLYIEQDWAELVATGSGSLERSARPRELAEASGA